VPVFRYDGNEPGALNFNFRRGDKVSLVLPMAALADGSYTTSTVQGVTLYTVVTPFDLTGTTWEAGIGALGATPVCEPTVTHDGTGGQLTITITETQSLAVPSGSYSFELAETTTNVRQQVLLGTVRVREGALIVP